MKTDNKKEVLFSVTRDDCEWTYYIGPGNGGQKKQKTSSGARCIHKASKAEGKSHDTRSQWDNRKLAFKRMTETNTFKTWIKLEMARRLRDVSYEEQEKERIKRIVDNSMKSGNIKTQIKVDKEWVDVSDEYWQTLKETE